MVATLSPTARRAGLPVAPVAVGTATVAYLAVAGLADPFSETTVGGVTIQCPVHGVTGGFCPGCGSTRAVHELLHGDIVGSLACHPLVLPLVVLLGYLAASWAARRRGAVTRWARSATELPAWLPVLVFTGFVVLTIVRNVPGMEWLVPPDVAP